jgi:hypothetical protein
MSFDLHRRHPSKELFMEAISLTPAFYPRSIALFILAGLMEIGAGVWRATARTFATLEGALSA